MSADVKAAETKPVEAKPATVLIRKVLPGFYSHLGVKYEQGKVYEVTPALRDWLCGQDFGYVDAVGQPLKHFVDFDPEAHRAHSQEAGFVPLTIEGAKALEERPDRPGGMRVATPWVDPEGQIDTAIPAPAVARRTARDPDEATRMLGGQRRVPV